MLVNLMIATAFTLSLMSAFVKAFDQVLDSADCSTTIKKDHQP